jgi:uncharacterized protein
MPHTPITLLFIGIFAVIYVPLTLQVGLRREQTNIHFLDGGDQLLMRRMRAQGNFTENVPIALLAMAAAELLNAPTWLLWSGGGCLLLGRLYHALCVLTKGWGLGRANAMLMTLAPILAFGIWAIYKSVT